MKTTQTIIQPSKKVKKSDLKNLIAKYIYDYIYKYYRYVNAEDCKKHYSITTDSIYIRVEFDARSEYLSVEEKKKRFCTDNKRKLERDFKKFSNMINKISFGNLEITYYFVGSITNSETGKSVYLINYIEIACAYEIINDC